MSNIALRIGLLALVAPVTFIACDGDKGDTESEYTEPVADAGADQDKLIGDSVTLDGTASTGDSALTLSYTWTFRQVPVESAISDEDFGDDNGSDAAVTVEWTPDVVGTYVAALTVSDGINNSDPDIVIIEVSSNNLAPIADAGDDEDGEEGVRHSLDGSGSYDPDGDDLEYYWTLAGAPDGSSLTSDDVYNSTSSSASFVPDSDGDFVFSLVVSDGIEDSDPDYVTITVDPSNSQPVADAGASETLSPCADNELELNGYGSYDADGDEITYEWSVTSMPSDSACDDSCFDDTTVPQPVFTWDVTGTYTFELQVSDGETSSAPDTVTYVMVDSEENTAPVADAGDAQTIEATADCIGQDYVWTCEPCDAQEFEVDGTGSYDDDGDELAYNWTDASGELTISSPYTAVSVVEVGESEGEYGVASSTDFELTLSVADCALSDEDTITLTVECTGEKK